MQQKRAIWHIIATCTDIEKLYFVFYPSESFHTSMGATERLLCVMDWVTFTTLCYFLVLSRAVTITSNDTSGEDALIWCICRNW